MSVKWVVVADSTRARIFQAAENSEILTEMEDFHNPAARMEEQELRNAAKGHFFGSPEGSPGHSAEPRTSSLEHSVAVFSKVIADYLLKAHQENRFGSLALVADPDFLGHLRSHMPTMLKHTVTQDLNKDLADWSVSELQTYLKIHLQQGSRPV